MINIGAKYNHLTILSYHGANNNYVKYYTCLCECGKIKNIRGSNIKSGKIKSCGCKQYERYNNTNILGIPNIIKLCTYWLCTDGYDDAYISRKLDYSVTTIHKYRTDFGFKPRATAKTAKYVRWLANNSRNVRDCDKPWFDKESLYCDKEFLQTLFNKQIGDV